jgi:protoporphyrinogen IX oxidase
MLWLKALHLIAMVTWFAGLFYLPRLFVYHAMANSDGDRHGSERFKIMERKLYYGITTPGGIATLFFGGWLLSYNPDYYFSVGWMWTKFALLALLVIYHVYCGKLLRDFKFERNCHGHVWYRWFNELPVLALIAIVLLAVLKPY